MVKGALRQLLSVELSSGKTPSSDRMVHGEKFSFLVIPVGGFHI